MISRLQHRLPIAFGLLSILFALTAIPVQVQAQKKTPDFKPHAEVLKGYEKVVSTADGKKSLYTIYTRKKDAQMYAELPSNYASSKYFIALTVASGNRFAGLQYGDMYVYWRRFNKKLALIQPNIRTRSDGDAESKASVKRLFTDRVLLEVPIATIGPGGGPVIDMDDLLVRKSNIFFRTYSFVNRKMPSLITIKQAKAFKDNVELSFEVPNFSGQLQTLHYSISKISGSRGYKPRKADERIGYFTTIYDDLGKYSDESKRIRFINRWHLEKADSSLKFSPPKKPIKFYIEHTTPVRYRRWVAEGVLSWNKAFEKVGLFNAIQVEFQDAKTGAHMEKDPEDVNFNFIRWLNNDMGLAIGPSRVNPVTGEILDADIILTDGWIRHYHLQYTKILPQIAMQGFGAETLAWLATRPNWDPRVLLADPSERSRIHREVLKKSQLPMAGHPIAQADPSMIGDDEFDGLVGRTSQINGMCLASRGKAIDVALMRMWMNVGAGLFAEADGEKTDGEGKDDKKKEGDKKDDKDGEKKDDKKKTAEKKPAEPMIDGMPESFIGPLLAHLVAHEVGHTLGLRHNFKGSSVYSLADINSEKFKGKKTLGSSVMDYTPVNINVKGGEVQGDYAMLGIGPYDMWAIDYGYTFEKDLKPILARVSEPDLQFGTDEDTYGPDPLAWPYDFSSDPLQFAEDQMRLARHNRGLIIEKFVKDGESWAKARRGYELTLMLQVYSVRMMANWVGGAHVYRDRKGDKNARVPIEVVPADTQRNALKFVVENTFRDSSYGLSPDLLRRMTIDKWLDDDNFAAAFSDSTWPVHERIMRIQASTLTMLMNPTTLGWVYDNEFRIPADQDALTLPELFSTLKAGIWTELANKPDKQFTARVPMVTSLRRNLQRVYTKRLIDLSLPGKGGSTSAQPVADLATTQLREIQTQIQALFKQDAEKIDPYTRAHLSETSELIAKALDSQYIYNAKDIGGGGSTLIFRLGEETGGDKDR